MKDIAIRDMKKIVKQQQSNSKVIVIEIKTYHQVNILIKLNLT